MVGNKNSYFTASPETDCFSSLWSHLKNPGKDLSGLIGSHAELWTQQKHMLHLVEGYSSKERLFFPENEEVTGRLNNRCLPHMFTFQGCVWGLEVMYMKHQLWNDDSKYYLSISGHPGSMYRAIISCRQKHTLFFLILLTLGQSL